MIDVGTLVMKVNADTAKFQKGMNVVNKGMSKIGGVMKTAAKGIAIGTAAVGTAMGAIGISAVNAAKDFDAEMSKVGAITQSTDAQMKKLEESALSLGATTAFSAKEAAEGMSFLGMAGFDTNQIISAMPGLLDLAAASGSDLAQTADIVSDAMSAFKLEAKDTGHFADVLAKTTTSANVTVDTLGESFKFAAPVAGALGFSIEDVATALGTMGNKGIKASQAGTALRQAMTVMATSAEDAGSILRKDLGVELTNADGTMRDLGDIVLDLQESFKGMTEAQKASTAEAVFGKNAMTGMLAIIDDVDGSFISLNESLEDANGTAKDMADKMLDNLSGELKLLGSAAEGAKIAIGKKLEPVIRDVVKWVTRNMPVFQDAFLTAFGGVTKFIKNTLVPIFSRVSGWWEKHGEDIKKRAIDVFGKMKEYGEKASTFFETNMLPVFEKIYTWWSVNGEAVGGIAADVFNGIVTVATTLWDYFDKTLLPILGAVGDAVILNWPHMKAVAKTTFDAITLYANPLIEKIRDELIVEIERISKSFYVVGEFTRIAFSNGEEDVEGFIGVIIRLNTAIDNLKNSMPDWLVNAIDRGISFSNPADAFNLNLDKALSGLEAFNIGYDAEKTSRLTTGEGLSGKEIAAIVKAELANPTNSKTTSGLGVINVNFAGATIMSEREAKKVMQAGIDELKRYGVK
jgi:TP901 family phage tail tape measure protein